MYVFTASRLDPTSSDGKSFCSTLAREEKQKTQSPMSDLRAVFYLMTKAFLNQIFYLLKGCRGSTIETIGDLDVRHTL